MTMAKSSAAGLLLFLVAVIPAAVAENYVVGGSAEWNQGIDYTAWTTGKTFRVGDTLEFKYDGSHTVDVVDKNGYDSCIPSGASTFSDGDTKITLKAPGPMYFICTAFGHCQGGMKLAVTVLASSPTTPSTPSTPESPSPPSSTPGTPSTPSTPGSPPTPSTNPGSPPPPSSTTGSPPPGNSAASRGVMSYLVMGVPVVLGYGAWMMG